MTGTMRRVSIAALPMTLLGAATPLPGPSATLLLSKSYDVGAGLGTGTRQEYHRLDGDSCKAKKSLAVFSPITGARKEVAVVPGAPLTVWALTTHYRFGLRTYCQAARTFTPRPGARYAVALRTAVLTGCTLDVREADTAGPLADAVDRPELTCKSMKGLKPLSDLR